jgi:hypothetical protein
VITGSKQAMAVRNQEKGQWKKGQSGNPTGRPPIVKELREFLQERLSEPDPLKAGKTNLEALAERLFQMGQKGNLKAIELVFNYAYGKPKENENQNSEGCRVIMPKPVESVTVRITGPEPPHE